MADGVLTRREGGFSRSGDEDLVEGGCGDGSLGSGLGDLGSGFGFAFPPPIFPSPLDGFGWGFRGGGEGDGNSLVGDFIGSAFLEVGGPFPGWVCCLNLGGVSCRSNSSSSSSDAVSRSICPVSLVSLVSLGSGSSLLSGSAMRGAVPCMSSDSHHLFGGGYTFSRSEGASDPEISLRILEVSPASRDCLFISSSHACSSNGATPLTYSAAWANDVSFRAPRSPDVPGKIVLNSIPMASILSNSLARTQSFCLS